MANSDKNIRITPNKNTISYPKIVFTGQTNAPITLNVLDDNSLSFEGTSGQLFSISNNISSGTIFSVSDISGIPSLRINADGTVGIAEFSGNVGIGLTNPQYKLHVNGTFGVTGAFALLSNTQSTSSTTGALTISGGLGVSGNLNVGTGLTVSGTVGIVGREIITNTTTSTSYNTGALVVSGGVGISGPLYATKAGFGTENTSAGVHIVSPSTSTNSLVISKRPSQTSNTFLINDANGNPLISTSYTAGSGETGNGVLSIHANREIGDAGSDSVFKILNGSSFVGGFARDGVLKVSNSIRLADETSIFSFGGTRINVGLNIWMGSSSLYFNTSGATFSGASSNRQTFSGLSSTSAIAYAFYAGSWSDNTRVLGIISPSGGDRSYFAGYGNLVINVTGYNGSNGWDATNLLSVNIDQFSAFTGNLAQFSVSGTNRFVIGPAGDTQILISSASAKGLIVKGAASQTANLQE